MTTERTTFPVMPIDPAIPSLGEIIATIYEEMLACHGDPEIAAVATASVVNELLVSLACGRNSDEVS